MTKKTPIVIKQTEFDPETREFVKELRAYYRGAIERSEKSVTTPKINHRGSCPNCKSLKYFDLVGSSKKRCAECKEIY